MADEPKRWGTTEMIITVLSVIGALGFGAWIFYLGMRSGTGVLGGGSSRPALPGLDSRIEQIRSYIRAANASDDHQAALTNAGTALALLQDIEATYGPAAVRSACNPDKLRRLIAKVQSRHAAAA